MLQSTRRATYDYTVKDKKIIIYEAEKTKDAERNVTISAYKPIHPGKLWAYRRQLSAKEYYAAHAINLSEEILFIVNWRADLAAADTRRMFLRHNDAWYTFERIDTYEGNKDNLRLYVSRLNSAPDPTLVKEYSE